MCNRPIFWEAFKLNPPLFPNCRIIAGLLRFGPEIMFNAQRYEVMPDGWMIMENGKYRLGTQREYQNEIN
eukprot:11659699-Karenia_brevis.AAC.1